MPVPAAIDLDMVVFWSHMSGVLQQTCHLAQLMYHQPVGFCQFYHLTTLQPFQMETQMER